MIYATISADIVDSTKMTTEDMILVSKCLNDFLHPMMKVSKGSWGRVVKGDAFECVLEQPHDLLRVALMLKCHVNEAIGFLIAAKSILRFSSVNESEKSEYVVAGTFISFCIALILGLLVLKLSCFF